MPPLDCIEDQGRPSEHVRAAVRGRGGPGLPLHSRTEVETLFLTGSALVMDELVLIDVIVNNARAVIAARQGPGDPFPLLGKFEIERLKPIGLLCCEVGSDKLCMGKKA